MRIIERLLKIVGKDDFQLDPAIDTGYILRQCWKYGWMMVRGKFFSIVYKKIANDVFIGKKVMTLEKKHLSVGSKSKLQDGVYIDALSWGGYRLGTTWLLEEIRELNVRAVCKALVKA